jgi:CheY-like chemotaxis protein
VRYNLVNLLPKLFKYLSVGKFLIRIHEQFPKIIKIMLTGQADEVAIERVKKYANLHRCLSKPWSEADLLQTIKSGLSKL